MILTLAQRAERARIIRYITLLGPMPCPQCGGSLVPEVDDDGAGWACILCPHRRWWNVPDEAGYKHLRPSDMCRKLTDEQLDGVFKRLDEGTKLIVICREFGLNRQTVSHIRDQWLCERIV